MCSTLPITFVDYINLVIIDCNNTICYFHLFGFIRKHLEAETLPFFQNTTNFSIVEDWKKELAVNFRLGVRYLSDVVKLFNNGRNTGLYNDYRSDKLEELLKRLVGVEFHLMSSFGVKVKRTIKSMNDMITLARQRDEQLSVPLVSIKDSCNNYFIEKVNCTNAVFEFYKNITNEIKHPHSEFLKSEIDYMSFLSTLQVGTLWITRNISF